MGKRNSHFFRIVAIEESRKNGGKALEILGFWYPKTQEKEINKNAVKKWISRGAQISPAVEKLLA